MYTGRRGMDVMGIVAIEGGRTIAQLCRDVSDVLPLPGIGVAAAVALSILALCETASINKKETLFLAARTTHLITALKEGTRGLESTRVQEAGEKAIITLQLVLKQYEQWAAYNRVQRVLFATRISEEISACHAEIDQCIQTLGLVVSIEMLHWQDAASRYRAEDLQEIVGRMDVLLEGQLQTHVQLDELRHIASENAEINRALVSQFAGFMQASLPQYPQGDRRHVDLEEKLYNIKEATGVLPPRTILRGREVRRMGQHPVAMGPQFDIWEGIYMEKEKVALKVLRGVQAKPDQMKRFERESKIWRQVWERDRGTFILAYYGTVENDGPYPYMVSPWQHNGTANMYCAKYPEMDRIPLIRGIAKGLELLHTWDPPIIHGDIKGENILIGDRGQPLITDFSLSKILEDVTGVPFTQSKGISDSYRWFAPEICSAPGILTTHSDMFSFAMTILELITCQQPYAEVRRTTEVLFNMQKGLRPLRPADPRMIGRGLTDKMWALIEQCWVHEHTKRIPIQDFLRVLETVRDP